MARVRRHADFDTREARRGLRARGEPYWMVIESGLSLGYRKTAEGGAWIVKRNIVMPPDAEHPKPWRRRPERPLGIADDYRDADGAEVLDFKQAQRKAMSDYVGFLQEHRKSADDAEAKLNTYALPLLGERRVAELTEEDFDGWLKWALARRRKVKKPSREADVSPHPTPEELIERKRRRKATLNRVINAFKACLNHAHATKKVPTREAWARLQKYRSADSARLRWLTVEEARRLQNACSPDLRPLVRAALLTGCRAGELLAVHAGDFDPRSKTLLIADSKSSKPRRVPLTEEGVSVFDALIAGKSESERLFFRADGSSWYRMAVVRAMKEACEGGKITPAATFHTLRHTYASHLVQAGTPLLFVASALGHSDTRMVEKHYGHLAPSHVADMIRANLPSFDAAPKGKVRSIRR
jgi:integrase